MCAFQNQERGLRITEHLLTQMYNPRSCPRAEQSEKDGDVYKTVFEVDTVSLRYQSTKLVGVNASTTKLLFVCLSYNKKEKVMLIE